MRTRPSLEERRDALVGSGSLWKHEDRLRLLAFQQILQDLSRLGRSPIAGCRSITSGHASGAMF
jgi:hypothetical protein